MASILTNIGAIAALQTLRSISSEMSDTQNEVSSGLRVGQASDNAAYWSIATTMRSDNMALSAVEDALGLGAAKVDTAYAGMTAVVEVLENMKAKLVTAHEEGVDKAKIQGELEQLKQQVVGTANAASFSGQNWLRSEDQSSSSDATVVSSFVRDSSGVRVETIDVDLSKFNLFNADSTGLLEATPVMSIGEAGGFMGTEFSNQQSYLGRVQINGVTSPATFSASDEVSFRLTVDESPASSGQTFDITINKALIDTALDTTDGTIQRAEDLRKVLQHAFVEQAVPASVGTNSLVNYIVTSLETSGLPGASIVFDNVTSTLAGDYAFGLGDTSVYVINSQNPVAYGGNFGFTGAFNIAGERLAFDYISNGQSKTVVIDQSLVDETLGVADGRIATANDLSLVLQAAFDGNNADIAVSALGTTIRIQPDGIYGDKSAITLSNVRALPPVNGELKYGLLDIDLVSGSGSVEEYVAAVETMLTRTISASSALGSIAGRIEMQSEFVAKLSDSIDRGVGRLVDADMNEASTRLKALQTQQQLAIQSLSIANTNSENIITLFR